MMSSRSLKFARALAEVASEQELTREAEQGLEEFSRLFGEHQELRETLESPAFSLETKLEIVRDVAAQAGCVEIVINFLCLLMEHNKIADLPEIGEAFQKVLDDMAGVVQVDVSSADSLDEDIKDRLEETLQRITESNVKLTFKVEEELIGGLKVQVGSTVYDGTIQTELKELRRRLAVEE